MNDNPTMMPMSLRQIAQAVAGRLITSESQSSHDPIATSAVSDSRQVREGSVFVAIAGERVDGHDYVARASGRGAVVALVEHEVKDAAIAQIVVPNTVEALGLLAKYNIELRRAKDTPFSVVGVTGSVGKTTTKDLLAALLSDMGSTVAPVGSFNNEIGLPLTALKVGENTRFLVAEMGANHVGEIANLTSLVPPDLAVVLKVGVAHLGEFGSPERIVQAKREIVEGLLPGGTAILNANDARVASMASAAADVIWFGMDDGTLPEGSMRADNVSTDDADRPHFTLTAPNGERCDVTLGIRGAHNVMNALAASTVALHLGMSLDRIGEVLESVASISPHRMAVSHVRRAGVAFTLIDDSFNANPDSTKAGLDGLKRWRAGRTTAPFRVAVLGAMLELGGDERELHRQVGAYAVESGVDALIAVGNATDKHFDSLAESLSVGGVEAQSASGDDHAVIQWVHDIDEADKVVCSLAGGHDDVVVLLKGSHFSGLSALAERWSADAIANANVQV